jgi:hypothetical protein
MHWKIEMIARGEPQVALRGTWTILRFFGSGDVAVVEAQSNCVHAGGGRYCNRHAFIFEVANQRVVAVREYMDTLYASEVLGTAGDGPGSFAPPAWNAPIPAVNRTEKLALALWEPLAVNDVKGFGAPFASDGTWWTDTGTDRALGAFDRLNLPPLSYPLHGRIPIWAKLEAMREGRTAGPRRPSLRVTPLRIVSQGDLAALEAESYCELLNGRIYQNRYAFVVEACADGIREVREYADTLHIAQTFSRAPAAIEER